ncbi:MAG: response regulator [Desulfobacteraceae bacterium]|nr:response regulator [Desulfobacteraceae bacterium]MBC2757010.1 response regulator [Desulfobacteraceae bacterium]
MIEMETQKTILFVDDEETILEIASEHFQNLGYQVLTARNGREAVKTFEDANHVIDCCFTDINMPEMDGLELAEYLRNYDNSIPVVIMTGYPSLDNTLQTLKNGVVDFLVKPVNLEQMTICLQRVLRERELFIKNILLNKELESKKRLEELNRELVFKVEELRVLNRIMTELMSLNTGSEVLYHIAEMATLITPASRAVFYAVSNSFDSPFELTSFDRCNIDNSENPECGEEIKHEIFNSALSDLIKEIAIDATPLMIVENTNQNLPDQIRSLMGIPLKIRDKVFGVLIALTTTEKKAFTEKDLYYLSFMIQQAAYLVENLALYENIYENLFSTLSAFVKTVEARDAYTKEHSSRVKDTAIIIAMAYGCSKEEIDVLDFAGRLHDIGKIGIRDDILLKPGRLTDAEYEKIKEHPLIGESIIGQLGLWDREKKIVRHHHEWFDGSGYPDGLQGDKIPLLARILSVADVYDAMVSDRAYRKEMPEGEVLGIISSGRGIQFDPRIVDLFLSLQAEGRFEQIYRLLE